MTTQNKNFEKVTITDSFWKNRIDVVRDQVIPYQWEALNDRLPDTEPSHAIKNFRIVAGEEEGEYYGMVFQDSDVAKWLETVAFMLEHTEDAALEKKADEVIDLLGRAQGEDGYLNTYYTLKEPGKRWTNLRDNHELYCAGHFIEAAVAYYNATGKTKFLEIVCKFADYIDTVFGPEEGKINGYPGHQEIELALVKLYEVTGNEKYLTLGKFFIDERGKEPHYFEVEKEARGDDQPFWFNNDHAYSQSHEPVRSQKKAVGHAVRAVYMYTAMADLAAKTQDPSLKVACETLWENVTQKQMYITAGIGSMEFGEAFSFDYDLPNDISYTETCASVGLVFWAKRMLDLEIHHQYADVMERALYNGTISGMDLDGNKYFYVNPLEVIPEACEKRHEKKHVKPVRQKWFQCACCPPNIARLTASIGHYIYSQKDNNLFVHLYMGNETAMEVNGQQVKLRQETNYPWEESGFITVSPQSEMEFTVGLRIPGWARGSVVKVNGEILNNETSIKNGYLYIQRVWKEHDTIEFSFEMTVERIQANPLVRANVGKVALQRGPIVYCLEQVDNGKNLHGLSLPRNVELSAEFEEDLLGGVVTLTGDGQRIEQNDWDGQLYRPAGERRKPVTIKAVPYYAWCNREPGEMIVWINEQ